MFIRRLAAVFVLLIASMGLAADRPPNIVFIMADDLGYGDLGSYGQEKIQTPHLDRLAAEGMQFTQFYAGAPVCAPSRSVLMTGKHTGHADIRGNREVKPEGQWPMDGDEITIAECLKKRGYVTGAFGKWGMGFVDTEGGPARQGFDEFFGYNCQREAHNFYPHHLWHNDKKVMLEGNDRGLTGQQYSHDLIADQALEFIRDNKDKPFFCYVPFTIPHLALQVPENSLSEYRGKWDDPPYEGGKGYLPHPTPRAAYAAMITRMDRDCGRIMDLVSELGLDENTIIMFTSDNGATFDIGGADTPFFKSNGILRGTKGRVYEGGIRVPLIARWKGRIEPGSVTDHVAAMWDVLPTLTQIAGAPTPSEIDGLSFLPTLLGKGDQPKHDYLYWEFKPYGGQQAVRLRGWKGVRVNMMADRKNYPNGRITRLELYNLKTDPSEKHDVAASHPDIVKRIEQIMAEAHVPSEEFPFPPID